MRRRPTLALALLASLSLTIFVVGCGSSEEGGQTHPDYAKTLAGAPAPLAALYDQANELLPGGGDAFDKRRETIGYPVVANVWASWCGPCRAEFSIFQEVSARMGKKVGFIGVDSEDSEAHARSFLENHPVPYPSYYDPGHEVASGLDLPGLPGTAFYKRDGELAYTKIGQWSHASELEADIHKYLLAES
jgi:cytochrome c biogenesis protein CcmG, thiol:disulfide interchange protein DsbE